MTPNVENYLHHLDGMDISETEKAEFIRTLWLIAQCFVDDAYSVRAVSEKSDVSLLKSGFDAANVIKFSNVKESCATAANDNASRANKEPRTRRKEA